MQHDGLDISIAETEEPVLPGHSGVNIRVFNDLQAMSAFDIGLLTGLQYAGFAGIANPDLSLQQCRPGAGLIMIAVDIEMRAQYLYFRIVGKRNLKRPVF